MTAHTDVATHTAATYAISAGLPATYDAAGYAATTITYTSIGKMAKFPTYGSRRAVTNFPMISEGIAKIKGAADYGGGDLMMADVPADAGQVILKAAEISSNHYSLKITYADGEVHYMDVLVHAWELSEGAEGAAMARTAAVAICRAPVVVAAT